MKPPNFFIIGAPKSGTTSLYNYLCTHPNIFMSEIKGPHFFATDLNNSRLVKTEKEYLDLFKPVKKHHLAIGEASVLYLYSREAIKNLYENYPKSKLIVLLRNPIDIIQSWHAEKLWSGTEITENIELAWKFAKVRRNNVESKYNDDAILDYPRIAMLGDQIQFLLNYFSKEQIKFIIFDELVKNTKEQYNDVIKFLELPFHNKDDFHIYNPYKEYKVKWIQNFLTHPPRLMIFILNIFKQLVGIKKINIIPKILKINTYHPHKPELKQTFKNKIIDDYYDDLQKLSKLLNKDFIKTWFST